MNALPTFNITILEKWWSIIFFQMMWQCLHTFSVCWLDTAENASFHDHERVVQLLLAAGANPDLQNKVRTAVYCTWGSSLCQSLPTVGNQAAALQLGNFAKATAIALAELRTAFTEVQVYSWYKHTCSCSNGRSFIAVHYWLLARSRASRTYSHRGLLGTVFLLLFFSCILI